MPVYEYHCSNCGYQFEQIKPLLQRFFAICPNCGEQGEKIMSLVNWSFGWRLKDECNERFGPRDEYEPDV